MFCFAEKLEALKHQWVFLVVTFNISENLP